MVLGERAAAAAAAATVVQTPTEDTVIRDFTRLMPKTTTRFLSSQRGLRLKLPKT